MDSAEGSLRSAVVLRNLLAVGIRRDTLLIVPVPGTPDDPHHAGAILASALYEVVCLRAEQRTEAGAAIGDAVRTAANEVGATMLGALFFSGEHRVTIEEYAITFLRTARLIVDETFASIAIDPFIVRGIVSDHFDPASTAGGTTASGNIRVDPKSLDAERLVDTLVKREIDPKQGEAQTPFLVFDRDMPYDLRVDPSSIRVSNAFRNPMVIRGGVVIRVAYDYRTPPPTPEGYAHNCSVGIDPDAFSRVMPAFAILLVGPDGKLIEAHTDRPL
jgi:hypothetical protein